MAECSVCGNDYDQAFNVTTAEGGKWTFDSLECATHAIAPRCAHCGCAILGHGVHAAGDTFCCAHCARAYTGADLVDRA